MTVRVVKWVVLVSLLVSVGGLVAVPSSTYAQGGDNDYVDVAVMLEVPDTITASVSHDLNIIVVNRGARTAYDVEVVVKVVSPEESMFRTESQPRATRRIVSLENDGRTLRWSIPALGGLQREEVAAKVTHSITGPPTPYDNTNLPHELSGEVTTSSFESDLHQENNTDRVWTYEYTRSHTSFREVLGNYLVGVAVDNATPSPGDTVNFTITADRTNPYSSVRRDRWATPPPIDLKVDIELTDGLTVTGMPTYGPETDRADSVSYSNGVFTIGTLQSGESRTNSVTLPITVASSAVVNQQCLTATLTGNPPPGFGPGDDDMSDNVAKVCVGPAPAGEVVLDRGEVSAFALFPCVGIDAHPCDGSDDIRVRAIGELGVVDGGKATFHIPDHILARAFDSHTGSVNSGDAVSWQTSCHEGSGSCTGFDPDRTEYGVKLGWNRIPFNTHWRRDGPPATGSWGWDQH